MNHHKYIEWHEQLSQRHKRLYISKRRTAYSEWTTIAETQTSISKCRTAYSEWTTIAETQTSISKRRKAYTARTTISRTTQTARHLSRDIIAVVSRAALCSITWWQLFRSHHILTYDTISADAVTRYDVYGSPTAPQENTTGSHGQIAEALDAATITREDKPPPSHLVFLVDCLSIVKHIQSPLTVWPCSHLLTVWP